MLSYIRFTNNPFILHSKVQTQHYLSCYRVTKLKTENLQSDYNKSQKNNVPMAQITHKTTKNNSHNKGSVMALWSWLSACSPLRVGRETRGVWAGMREYMWKQKQLWQLTWRV